MTTQPRLPDGKTINFIPRPTTLVRDIAEAVASYLGLSEGEICLVYGGEKLDDYKTIEDYNCEDGDPLDAHLVRRGGKPVIYLFPPSGESVPAQVSLKLSSAWSFSSIYPVAPVKALTSHNGVGGRGGEEIAWSVLAQDDGTLHDHSTSCDVSYLFWEAE